MEIREDAGLRERIFREIAEAQGGETRHETHLSDLLAPRLAYFRRVLPKPATEEELMYWLTGKGHETAFLSISGGNRIVSPGSPWQTAGIWWTADAWIGAYPTEIKTRRRQVPSDLRTGYDYYIKQLRGYCALAKVSKGYLFVWLLVDKVSPHSYETKPNLYTYEIDFTQQELEAEMARLEELKAAFELALIKHDLGEGAAHTSLPQCEPWMCGKWKKTLVTPPACHTCGKVFTTDYGLKKHKGGKKTSSHKVQFATFKWDFSKKCKWYDECKPELNPYEEPLEAVEVTEEMVEASELLPESDE